MESSPVNDSGRKVSLEELSQEELVKKCKSLLIIAQKAKQAKDVLQEENNNLKHKLTNESATSEIIDSLTQQKLEHITTIEDFKKQNVLLTSKLQKCLQDLCLSEEKNNSLDNENVSYKRQIKRLTDENEALLGHLESSERQIEECKRLGLEQQQQLLMLEQSDEKIEAPEVIQIKAENINLLDKLEVMKINLSEKDKNILIISEDFKVIANELETLKFQFESIQAQNEELSLSNLTFREDAEKNIQETIELRHTLQEITDKSIRDLKDTVEKLRSKLKLYHAKVVKFAGSVKVLKENKNQILILFKNYTSQVEDWKVQLSNSAQKLMQHIEKIEAANLEITKENNALKESNLKYIEQLEAHKTDDEKSKELHEIEKMKCEHQQLYEELTSCKEQLDTEKKDFNNKLQVVVDKHREADDESQREIKHNLEENEKICLEYRKVISKLEEETDNAAKEIVDLKQRNLTLQEDLQHHLQTERELSEKTGNEIIKLVQENHKLTEIISNLEQKICKSTNEIEIQTDQQEHEHLKALSELEEAAKEIAELKQSNLVLAEDLKNALKTECELSEKSGNEIIKLVQENTKLAELNSNLEEKICKSTSEMEIQTDQDQQENLRVILELKEAANEIAELKQRNLLLQADLQHALQTERQLSEESGNEIIKLVQENTKLAETNSNLEEKISKSTNEVEIQTNQEELGDTGDSLKRENSELLGEMNVMNQALKERGGTISHLQAHCEEIKKKLQVYETQANKNVDNLCEKDETIKQLRDEIASIKPTDGNQNHEVAKLKAELEQLKEKINSNHDGSYAESETLSTSTISRVDDLNRMKDLEGSWEERYGKLRNLAIKLKGKIRDLTAELAKEHSEKSDLQTKLASGAKTITNLQAQSDKLQDDLEAAKKENSENRAKLTQVAADISKDKQKLVDNEATISGLTKEIDDLKQEKISTETWKTRISAKVQALRKELDANRVLKKEFESKIAKLNGDLEAKEQALKTETDLHQQTKNSLQHSKNERKKNSVLTLEMQDYERSAKELSLKLDQKQEQIAKLKLQIDSQKSAGSALREQNKIQEERTLEMENQLDAAKAELIVYKKQTTDLEDLIAQKESKILHTTQLYENARSETEELSTELSKVLSEHQKAAALLRGEREHYRSHTLGLQQSLRETQDALKLKEDELGTIRVDYDGYKVRAQSVLRQNHSRDVGLEDKLAEELATLRVRCEVLNGELVECKAVVEDLRRKNCDLEREKVEAAGKCLELGGEVEDLKGVCEQLTHKYQQAVVEQGETVRGLKVHAETLAQCYRQQLSEQEVRHNREIIELQSKIEKAPSPELPFSPLATMHREEGEGSESTDSLNKSIHPMPLERLLGTDSDQEVALIRKQLNEEESKVTHLTELLADTEQDLAKHTQMNKLLKEEIRRQQRSVEREKHAENLEYLKNVVFKFVTIQNSDERVRLVPVLVTILKLSPEETQRLNLVARGEAGLRGWTNLLWSPSKP